MRVLWVTVFTILIDQVTKVVVLRTMYPSQSIPILGDWLKLTFTENPGMAFGITFGPKTLVTFFALFATVLITVYLSRVRQGFLPYRMSLALILGGALGNIIDRVFYGVFLGYETFFAGRVVDFIHVNLWTGYIPDAVPLVGGIPVSLFPIWNVADMAIVCGVVGILLFQKAYHRELLEAREAAFVNAPTPDVPADTDAAPGGAQSEVPADLPADGYVEPAVPTDEPAAGPDEAVPGGEERPS